MMFKSQLPALRRRCDKLLSGYGNLEKSRLDKKSLSHINDDILAIVKEAVR